MQLKVPYLPDAEIDSAAREVLQKYSKWKGSVPHPPIPIDEIVEGLFGLTLSIGDLCQRLEQAEVLGATWLQEGHVMIDASLEGNEGRFSFTLAHECGHWVLHRPIIEMEKVTVPLFPREPGAKPTPAVVCRNKQRHPAEIQADKFAARLLMPASDVRSVAKLITASPLAIAGLEARRSASEAIPELRSFAAELIDRGKFSNVSNQAMQIRLLDLKLAVDQRQGVLLT
jgi:Zn-dependent peptidase ImmA (M78 family)